LLSLVDVNLPITVLKVSKPFVSVCNCAQRYKSDGHISGLRSKQTLWLRVSPITSEIPNQKSCSRSTLNSVECFIYSFQNYVTNKLHRVLINVSLCQKRV